jgi:hypoxia up-regulated 1
MAYLDREVKYLVNKIKAWRPKEKPKKKKKPANETTPPAENQEETQQEVPQEKTEEDDGAEVPVEEVPIGEGIVEEPTLEQIDPSPTDTTEESKGEEHTEL